MDLLVGPRFVIFYAAAVSTRCLPQTKQSLWPCWRRWHAARPWCSAGYERLNSWSRTAQMAGYSQSATSKGWLRESWMHGSIGKCWEQRGEKLCGAVTTREHFIRNWQSRSDSALWSIVLVADRARSRFTDGVRG